MGDEKRSENEKEPKSGLPQISAMHVIIAVAVIVLAVIFIAKFGFNMDLISPSSGEMAIVKRPVTAVPTLIQKEVVRPTLSLRPEPVPTCSVPTTMCGDSCSDTATDPNNCGYCGRVCSVAYADAKNVAEYGCAAGECTIKSCQPGYGDCRTKGPLNVNGGACETNLKTGDVWNAAGGQVVIVDPNLFPKPIYIKDATDCGSCGNSCVDHTPNVISFCDNGACRKVCRGYWLDCNNNMADNCETGWDDNNCGACGAKCPSGTNCYTGCCRTTLRYSQGQVIPPECQTDSLGGKARFPWMGA
jgi:hypothetical protein